MKVLVVDDERLSGTLISEYLKNDDRVSSVEYSDDTENLLNKIGGDNIDLVFLDLFMPNDIQISDLIGLELLKQIKTKYKEVKVVILSSHYEYKLIEKAEKYGCDGYLSKNITLDKLNDAITQIGNGRVYYCQECKHVRMNQYESPSNVDYEMIKVKISQRQIEILKLLELGKNLKEIAHELGISTNTVEFHKKNLFKMFGQNKVTAIVSIAIRNNII